MSAMSGSVGRDLRGAVPLTAVSGVVVLVVLGLAHGLWLENLHNGLLALAFTAVGAYVHIERPGHREGWLFLATGIVEAVMFLGRQIGRTPGSGATDWWGWLGVWPLAIALALTTLSVICFPDGRLPSPRWRGVVAGVVIVAAVCATLSALTLVEYESAGVATRHPVTGHASGLATSVWSALAHPAYVAFQLLWIVAITMRWRGARGHVRVQLACLASAAAVSVIALAVGLAVGGSPTPGVLSAALVPLAAGWAIVHGRHLAAYSALSWLSRTGAASTDLPADLAGAVAGALDAPAATVWVGSDDLHALGVWPDSDGPIEPTTIAALLDSAHHHVRVVGRHGSTLGALSVERARLDRLSLSEQRLFDDLASHAAFVLDHVGLAQLLARRGTDGHLHVLTPRERDVLELMARGLSNAAICAELHVNIKTVEPVISAIFTKLGLQPDSRSNRRVLAVLTYLRA